MWNDFLHMNSLRLFCLGTPSLALPDQFRGHIPAVGGGEQGRIFDVGVGHVEIRSHPGYAPRTLRKHLAQLLCEKSRLLEGGEVIALL
jgi:hypothetical protein